MKEGQDLMAKHQDFPNRKFRLTKKIKENQDCQLFFGIAQFWGSNSNKEFALKIYQKNLVKTKEIEFIKQIINNQNQKQDDNLSLNIIKIIDQFEINQFWIVVMEKGENDLLNFFSKNKSTITIKQKLQICLELTLSIFYLHSQGITHSNIHPQCFLKAGDKFKLIDFGLATKDFSDIQKNQDVYSFQYKSPESFDEQPEYSEKEDFWSLACIYYRILNENPLFDDQNQESIKQKIINYRQNQQEINNKINNLGCDSQFKSLIIKMLSPDKSQRFNLYEVIDQIQKITNTSSINLQNPLIQFSSQQNLQNQIIPEQTEQSEFSEQQITIIQQMIQNSIEVFEKKLNQQIIEQVDSKYSLLSNENNQTFQIFTKKIDENINNQNQIIKNELQQQQIEITKNTSQQIFEQFQQKNGQLYQATEQLIKSNKQDTQFYEQELQQVKEELKNQQNIVKQQIEQSIASIKQEIFSTIEQLKLIHDENNQISEKQLIHTNLISEINQIQQSLNNFQTTQENVNNNLKQQIQQFKQFIQNKEKQQKISQSICFDNTPQENHINQDNQDLDPSLKGYINDKNSINSQNQFIQQQNINQEKYISNLLNELSAAKSQIKSLTDELKYQNERNKFEKQENLNEQNLFLKNQIKNEKQEKVSLQNELNLLKAQIQENQSLSNTVQRLVEGLEKLTVEERADYVQDNPENFEKLFKLLNGE